jgi:phenylacetate-CoA ligase
VNAKLRTDLRWSVEEDSSSHVLHDPVTGRLLAWDKIQHEIIRALDGASSISQVRHALAARGDPNLDLEESLLELFVGFLDDLGLLERGLSPKEIRERQRVAKRALVEEEQVAALTELVERVRQSVPFYHDLFEGLPLAMDTVGDVRRLPRLTKEALRQNFHRLLPEKMEAGEGNSSLITISTSGTTGERMQLVSRADYGINTATNALYLNRDFRELIEKRQGLGAVRHCTLTTAICSGTECHVGVDLPLEARLHEPELLLETGMKIMSFSAERLDRMVQEVSSFQPDYLLGDPAYLAVLARHVAERRPKLPTIPFIVTSYELCSELHRRLLEKVFECPLYEVYGSFEAGWIAIQCEHGRYHVADESVILEVLDGEEPAGEDAVGQMIVTTLRREIMPVIRYETGDLARTAGPCSCSHSETTTLACVEGRIKDVITDVEGSPVTPRAVDRAVSAVARGIIFYCVLQEGPRAYRLLLVPEKGYRDSDGEAVRAALLELLGTSSSIAVEPRRELLPEPSGKFRLTYQHASLGAATSLLASFAR